MHVNSLVHAASGGRSARAIVRPAGLHFFVSVLLLSIFTLLFSLYSSVSLPNFIFDVPMHCARRTLVHEFYISNSHTECYLLLSRDEIVLTSEF